MRHFLERILKIQEIEEIREISGIVVIIIDDTPIAIDKGHYNKIKESQDEESRNHTPTGQTLPSRAKFAV